jgi:outer membrane lipoprotein-sorting protein
MILRNLLPVLFLISAVFPSPTYAQTAPAIAGDLVKKALDARGGEARIKSIQAQRVTGTISFGPSLDGPFFVELKRPGKVHMEVVIQGQTVLRIYDGHAGWLVNPFAEDKSPQPMTGNDLKNIAEESDFDGPLVDYQKKGNKIELLGKDQVDGKPAVKLKLTTSAGDARTYYFDASTFLLLKWEGVRKSEDQEIPVESLFGDYRDVNGLKFPFKVNTDSPGSNRSQNLVIEKIELNAQIDDAHFAKPAEPVAPKTAAPSVAPPKENPERR